MANIETSQFKETVHIPKYKLREIVSMDALNETELRVFIYLLTVLTGHNRNRYDDHKNFTKLSPKIIAQETWIDKSDVKDAIKTLTTLGIIERGNGPSVKDGYRFTF